MTLEVGIGLALADVPAEQALALVRQAEAGGLDLVVVTGEEGGFDPWTTAVWLAAGTGRIQIGTHPPDWPFPAVAAKAVDSAEALTPARLVVGDHTWVSAPVDADAEALVELSAPGLPVVVPVRTADDVARVVALAVGLPRIRSTRPAAVRARRRPGIAYDDVPASLAERAVEPGDPAYRSVRATYMRGGAPGLVLRPRTVEEVVDAVAFARDHRHLPLGVRSGGHGISGRSTNNGGLVVDVGALDDIEILDEERRLVRVGPGATWKQVAAGLDSRGWAVGSGDYGGVGVGGLATAGGIGFLSRKHGLTIDHLRAVELVLADGSRVRASSDEHPDLFWAVRGAGANFGIATAFELEVSEVAAVGWAQLVLVVPDLEEALLRFGEVATAAPRDTTVFFLTGQPQQGQSVVQLYGMVESGDADVIIERLTPFAELGALVQQQVSLARYADVMGQAADVGPEGHHGGGDPAARSAFVPRMTPELAADTAALLRSGLVRFFQLRTMGGAIADVPADETAFAHRTPDFSAVAMGGDRAALDVAWDKLAHHFDGLYLSFETDLRPERLRDAFPPAVLTRLRDLKRRYDPQNLFRDNFNIDPEEG